MPVTHGVTGSSPVRTAKAPDFTSKNVKSGVFILNTKQKRELLFYVLRILVANKKHLWNMNVVQIHFSQNLSYISSVVFDTNAILLALENSDSINVLLDKQQTIEDMDLLLSQLTKFLAQNIGKRYNYTFHDIA